MSIHGRSFFKAIGRGPYLWVLLKVENAEIGVSPFGGPGFYAKYALGEISWEENFPAGFSGPV
jgi:hypothetical protein